MNGGNNVSPNIMMYLRLFCLTDNPAAVVLTAAVEQLMPINSGDFFVELKQSKGCSYQEPFTAIKIGYEVYEYNLELFEERTNTLFEKLMNNQTLLVDLTENASVETGFVININSMNSEEQPAFYLSSAQMSFLAKLRSSLILDGYLMFGEEEEEEEEESAPLTP